ncbi:MAG TPA: RNA-binding transcriptional accessory protein [Clostridiales bacterium]|nr:RNA-binding transcriptional accessory protein [Clostridiales bacterium]
MVDIIDMLSEELGISVKQVKRTVDLIDKGNTIPFIARYRKEVTGGLDDIVLRELYEKLNYLKSLEERREDIIRLIKEQDKLTDELLVKIQGAKTLTELDDIYRPFRPKRRTRATIAKEKGLEPLANMLWTKSIEDVEGIAGQYIDEANEVLTVNDALQGAMDIIAEDISDNADYRKTIREYIYKNASIVSKGEKEERSVYEIYYDYKEPVSQIAPHRILAINRGEKEGYLSVKVDVEDEKVIDLLISMIEADKEEFTKEYVYMAASDSYRRLIAPSIEREIRKQLTEEGEEQAIEVFAKNVRSLLLQPPVKDKKVMGIDPGYRTGNKVAVVDQMGNVLDTAVIYMTLPEHDKDKAKAKLLELILEYDVDVIAIGNGTASKETEIVVVELISELEREVLYMVVSEAGASVYSASRLAAEEFPEFDVSLRSAVSIARRLQDPLAELVKINPKSIGVGQYQHDVNQKKLADTLKGVVEDCVNLVGVDLNTASPSLLSYVAGISNTVAKNIVIYREEQGGYKNRDELLNVKGLGIKTFQQCAGFLRIPRGGNIFDNTGVHPESYEAAKRLLPMLDYTLKDVEKGDIRDIDERVTKIGIQKLAEELDIGEPTLKDIIEELKKPGRDPRDELPKPMLRSDIMAIEDLKPDMILKGTVRNVVDFGAFVDIGVHQDGLVHISELSDKFVHHPMDVLQVGDIVIVKVLDVDVERGRISLTMRDVKELN